MAPKKTRLVRTVAVADRPFIVRAAYGVCRRVYAGSCKCRDGSQPVACAVMEAAASEVLKLMGEEAERALAAMGEPT